MKKTKKLLPVILTLAMGVATTFAFTSCDKNYTTAETDTLISQLQSTIDGNKSELDEKIAALTEEYQAKDNELLAQITANQQALATLKTDYEAKIAALILADETNAKAITDLETEYLAKVEELVKADSDNAAALAELKTTYESKIAALEKADSDNQKAIADLESEYAEKVEELEGKITQANATIESNKTALEQAIAILKTDYEAKLVDLAVLIDAVEDTNKTQEERLAALEEIIVELSQKHVHAWDEAIPLVESTCQQKGFSVQYCKECREDKLIVYALSEHAYEQGVCVWCEDVQSKGLQYTLNANGVSYTVSDIGDCKDTEIAIPAKINGLPVTGIGNDAFEDCDSLTSVEIPDSVTSIGYDAFYGCSSLTIYCEAASMPSGWDSDWNYSNCPVVWYSETAPALNADGTAYEGNYWHYGESGEIVVWVYVKPEE